MYVTWLSHYGKGIAQLFENMVLRNSLCPSKEVMGRWSKLYNEELFDLYSLVNIIRVIKSRRLRWAGHVAYMVKQRNA
jgi:hypothetical protein